jgi:rhamnose utilization protein RhaD (predicted bifunctional aldolase and dehydrogenase)/NAD(P)-dependent dehydrogenase (short-subunit alcohol dehydrogenase family)
MQSLWSDADAEALVARYAQRGVARDLALRVYSARLLGRDPALVLHGGGNCSLKTVATDLLGDEIEVLHVKGSGADMADIEPAGLPAVRLAPLRRLRALDRLSDEDMVNFQRANLLDSAAPNPSVETLLHAFLPQRFVDHTHSTAVLALTDQPEGEARCREAFGKRAALVPYIMPGFALAKRAAEIFAASPEAEALILLKHGIFTFGDDARQSYDRMIAFARLAEARLRAGRRPVFAAAALPAAVAPVAAVAPILRGLTAVAHDAKSGIATPQILRFRRSPAILDYVNGAELSRYSQAGVATPDHAIRTKNWPLVLPAPEAGALDRWREAASRAVADFAARYHDYFARHDARRDPPKRELDPVPRVVLVPGLGLFGLGATASGADIAADIAESTIATVSAAEAIGRFESIAERDMFEVEYWALEQAKLGKAAAPRLQRHIVVVTGGGSGIGAATARAFAREGAELAILDRDAEAADRTAREVSTRALAIACDVTDAAQVAAAFDRVAEGFGGVDIVVSNAGGAWQGEIGTVDDAVLRRSFEVNFFAHQNVARNAVRVMRAQRLGGALLFNVSKQAVNPGRNFGPYGVPKSAALALMRQYALDHGGDGIRANAVNADRVRTGLLDDGMIAARARARGLSEEAYMAGNLLGREVLAEDVAEAFVFLALARKTTAATVTVDGGNIEAALR